jgi:hypothetical protein
MNGDIENIIFSYFDIGEILELPNRNQLLQLPYFKKYSWLYQNFGIITNHYKSILLKNQKHLTDFLTSLESNKFEDIEINDIQSKANFNNIFYKEIGKKINIPYQVESLKNIVFKYVNHFALLNKRHMSEDDILEYNKLMSDISKYESNNDNNILDLFCRKQKLERGDIHPQFYPLSYLCKGILYYDIWECLTDIDIDKFALSYNINIELSRDQKISEIIRSQNELLKDLKNCNDDKFNFRTNYNLWYKMNKLIQKIEDDQIKPDIVVVLNNLSHLNLR